MLDLATAVSRGFGAVLAPDRWSARAALAAVKLKSASLVVTAPHAELAPFEAMTFDRLLAVVEAAPDRSILDATSARPWDDALWAAVLECFPDLPNRLILLRPERHTGRWTPAIGEPPLAGSTLRIMTSAGPVDDDSPILRRLVLEARTERSNELVVRLLRLGQHELIHGTLRRARAALTEGVSVARHATEDDRDGEKAHEKLHVLAAVLDTLGDIAVAVDDLEEADKAWKESATVSERLLRTRPEAETRWGTAVSALRLARSAHAHGQFVSAAQMARQAVEATPEDNPERLAAVLQSVAAMELGCGRIEAAEDALDRAAEALDELLVCAPRRFDLKADRLDVAVQRAQAALLQDDIETARTVLLVAGALADELTRREPSRADWITAVAATGSTMGDLLLATGEIDAARTALRHAERMLDHLLERDPERRAAQCERARIRRRLVYALGAMNDIEGARLCAEQDAETTGMLLAALPSSPMRAHDEALSLAARAWLAGQSADTIQAAMPLWQQAVRRAEQAAVGDSPAVERTLIRTRDALERARQLPLAV